ncbi:putative membrane protein [Microbacterium sp. AK009]|uniref:YhgE/Pip family protein n=1 Tax=Microbacterium sp. AK009 TaxID=2723068 RepID=UPI0015CE3B2B|nr:YhgE/Pip family protein [Microbacterium sp. AK009]NYF17799.1 putative membrane protein [Microbacterium sp. AK009]
MTLPLERARSPKPVTWLTILGVLLLPVIVGGILVAALYNPTERLDQLNAAIVNDDEPVEIDGQTVPLGRQLSAGLVEGSDDQESNLTWTISNEDDAAAGLADGTYAAVVTIPANFSAAATSTQPGETPEQATIEVTTPPDSRVVDDAITAQVTSTAASLVGQQLSETFLENVFLGFTTLGEQLGEAASGADDLADGAGQLADGAAQAADGAAELADGAGQLAGGAAQAADGAAALPGGISQLGSGAGQLAGGASGLSQGALELQSGLTQIAGGIRGAADGAGQLSAGVRAGADELERTGLVPDQISGFAQSAADGSALTAEQIGGVAQSLGAIAPAAGGLAESLGQLAATCATSVDSPEFCAQVAAAAGTAGTTAADIGAAAQSAGGAAQTAVDAATAAGATNGALQQFDTEGATEFASRFRTIAHSVDQLAGGLGQLAGATDQSAAGAGQLAGGAGQLGSGASALASGAQQAAEGAQSLATGVRGLSDGAAGVSEGTAGLADGVQSLSEGAAGVSDGTTSLADGLATATDEIPSYSEAEATDLATVVADPVAAQGVGDNLFGASAIPLLSTLALWFGGLGTFVALQAVSRRALTSRAPSVVLALRGFLPAAVIGAVQGVLIAGIVQLAATYSWGEWTVYAAVCVVAGVAFAAVNQALVAVFGGIGRWISALVGVLVVATGVVSTVPGALTSVASLLPTAPAYQGMLAALTSADGLGAGLAGLAVWTVLALIASVLAVSRRRTVSARSLRASPAPA